MSAVSPSSSKSPAPAHRGGRKKPPRTSGPGGNPNRRAYREAVEEAAAKRAVPVRHTQPTHALQETLDIAVGELRYAQTRVDALDPDAKRGDPEAFWRYTIGGMIPNEWVRLRDDRLGQVAALSNAMVRNGIAEREVVIQEAKAVLMISMVKQAAERAGFSKKDVAALGRELVGIVEEQRAARLGA